MKLMNLKWFLRTKNTTRSTCNVKEKRKNLRKRFSFEDNRWSNSSKDREKNVKLCSKNQGFRISFHTEQKMLKKLIVAHHIEQEKPSKAQSTISSEGTVEGTIP